MRRRPRCEAPYSSVLLNQTGLASRRSAAMLLDRSLDETADTRSKESARSQTEDDESPHLCGVHSSASTYTFHLFLSGEPCHHSELMCACLPFAVAMSIFCVLIQARRIIQSSDTTLLILPRRLREQPSSGSSCPTPTLQRGGPL